MEIYEAGLKFTGIHPPLPLVPGLKVCTTTATTTGFVLGFETGKEKNSCKIKAEVWIHMCRAKSYNKDIRDQTLLKDAGVLTHSDKSVLVNTLGSHLRI